MKPDKNKDITKHIAEILKRHSLPYEEGAWERFKDFEVAKKRKVVLWPYFTGVAAMVLIGMSLFLIIGKNETNDQQAVRQKVVKETIDMPDSESMDTNDVIDSERLAGLSRNENPTILSISSGSNSLKREQIDLKETKLTSVSSTENDANEYKEAQSIVATQPVASNNGPVSKDISTISSYAGMDSSDQNEMNIRDIKKWDFSIELSPNIKDNNVNFGGGFAVAYNLTDKISIGSGISYMHIDAQRAPNKVDIPPEFSTLDGTNNKSLNTVSTSLMGLDIPVNVKLNIGNVMYANAGVSVFSVLNESRYNSFEERIAVTALASPTLSSARKEASGLEAQTIHSKEMNANTPYEGKNFTGFFNISVGYRLPLFHKMNLAIEPYLKIPIGSLSDQDMDLNNGGFKVKASF